jgi:carbamoyltransferase
MIENLAEALVEKWWWSSGGLFDGNVRYNANDFINTSHLHKVKAYWHEHFNKVLQTVNLNVRGSKDGIKKSLVWQNDLSGRAVIGHYVQMILEVFYRHVIGEFQVENAIVTGGVHYNVKLNNFILKNIPGQFCAVPLAGDQGAAIGVYVKHGFRFPFTSLQWGRRVLPSPQGHTGTFEVDGARVYWKIGSAKVYWTDSRDSYVDTVTELLKQDHIVNTITGNMEFGPRALCNTSTLALATKENVDIINALNGRDTIMPFAPVMLEEKARRLFSPAELDRTIGSDRYMIVTHDWRQKVQPEWEGVTHPYPDGSGFSGRPQVIYPGDLMPVREILENLGGGPIINTSLNVHGMPIVFSEADAIDDFKFNLKMAKRHLIKKGPVLVIGAF